MRKLYHRKRFVRAKHHQTTNTDQPLVATDVDPSCSSPLFWTQAPDPEFIAKELIKCKQDFFHFLNYVILPIGTREVPFADYVYEKQKELIRTLLEHHYVIVNKSRQVGVSYILQAFCAWCVLFHYNLSIGVISRLGTEATDFNRKVMRIIDGVPLWLTGHKSTSDRYLKQTEQTFILENQSRVVCEAVSSTDPENTLRGKTIHLLIIDEAAFIRWPPALI